MRLSTPLALLLHAQARSASRSCDGLGLLAEDARSARCCEASSAELSRQPRTEPRPGRAAAAAGRPRGVPRRRRGAGQSGPGAGGRRHAPSAAPRRGIREDRSAPRSFRSIFIAIRSPGRRPRPARRTTRRRSASRSRLASRASSQRTGPGRGLAPAAAARAPGPSARGAVPPGPQPALPRRATAVASSGAREPARGTSAAPRARRSQAGSDGRSGPSARAAPASEARAAARAPPALRTKAGRGTGPAPPPARRRYLDQQSVLVPLHRKTSTRGAPALLISSAARPAPGAPPSPRCPSGQPSAAAASAPLIPSKPHQEEPGAGSRSGKHVDAPRTSARASSARELLGARRRIAEPLGPGGPTRRAARNGLPPAGDPPSRRRGPVARHVGARSRSPRRAQRPRLPQALATAATLAPCLLPRPPRVAARLARAGGEAVDGGGHYALDPSPAPLPRAPALCSLSRRPGAGPRAAASARRLVAGREAVAARRRGAPRRFVASRRWCASCDSIWTRGAGGAFQKRTETGRANRGDACPARRKKELEAARPVRRLPVVPSETGARHGTATARAAPPSERPERRSGERRCYAVASPAGRPVTKENERGDAAPGGGFQFFLPSRGRRRPRLALPVSVLFWKAPPAPRVHITVARRRTTSRGTIALELLAAERNALPPATRPRREAPRGAPPRAARKSSRLPLRPAAARGEAEAFRRWVEPCDPHRLPLSLRLGRSGPDAEDRRAGDDGASVAAVAEPEGARTPRSPGSARSRATWRATAGPRERRSPAGGGRSAPLDAAGAAWAERLCDPAAARGSSRGGGGARARARRPSRAPRAVTAPAPPVRPRRDERRRGRGRRSAAPRAPWTRGCTGRGPRWRRRSSMAGRRPAWRLFR